MGGSESPRTRVCFQPVPRLLAFSDLLLAAPLSPTLSDSDCLTSFSLLGPLWSSVLAAPGLSPGKPEASWDLSSCPLKPGLSQVMVQPVLEGSLEPLQARADFGLLDFEMNIYHHNFAATIQQKFLARLFKE